jgi:hypothetical protein
MSDLSEALKTALEEQGRFEDLEKAEALAQDIETLQDPPEALKEDVAELVGTDSYEAAKAKLERL